MGKGKKKKKANKGRRRGGKKATRDDTDEENDMMLDEQIERARLSASNRTEDPLKNWTRLQKEECPICMLPLPLEANDYKYCVTCGKTVCYGCVASTCRAHTNDGDDVETAIEKAMICPYCRSTRVYGDDKYRLKQEMKRANAGNGEAMYDIGIFYFKGMMGLQQDKAEGLKWLHRALEAGSGTAAYELGLLHDEGDGVEEDFDKALDYFKKAAELGYIPSYLALGNLLNDKGDIEEEMLNFRKAVMCGMSNDYLFDQLKLGFKCGFITKEEYAFTLREHHDARNEMKSDAREEYKSIRRSL